MMIISFGTHSDDKQILLLHNYLRARWMVAFKLRKISNFFNEIDNEEFNIFGVLDNVVNSIVK